MKSFCLALTIFASVSMAADEAIMTTTTTAGDIAMNGDMATNGDRAEPMNPEELKSHVRERHAELQMARDMVEMFCEHHDDKNHDDKEDGDKIDDKDPKRNLDGHKDGDEKEMDGDMQIENVHKLID